MYLFLRNFFLLTIGLSLPINLIYASQSEVKHIYQVNIDKVKAINLPSVISAVGHISAIKQVKLSFNADGQLKEKYFKNGDRVLKGELVAKLVDDQDLAELKSLKAKLSVAQQDAKRGDILVKSQAVSKSYVEQKNAALIVAQAAVDKQQIMVDHKKILAPFTGVLGSFNYDSGAYISSGASVVQLTQQAPLKVVYAIASNNKPRVATGNIVTLSSSMYPGKVFKGTVNFISPTISQNTGTLELEANIPNKNYLLSPGMFVSVVQTIKNKNLVNIIQETAVQTNKDGNFVWLIKTNDKVTSKKIIVSEIENGWAQISKGLKLGDKVVIIGGDKLSEGDQVHSSSIPPPKGETESFMKAYISEKLKKNEKNLPNAKP
jgi:RND family efflux transporter MFP subunit